MFARLGTSQSVLLFLSLHIRSAFALPSIANGVELRMLPLGDSITYGFNSGDGNGYRLVLQNLAEPDNNVVYAGTRRNGTMADNWMEGYPGKTIDEISGNITKSNVLSQKPNVVLLHVGTNDMLNDPPDAPYALAPCRLGSLIDQIVVACPDATVLVAQIINTKNSDAEERIKTFNSLVPYVVNRRVSQGKKVMVVDFQSITIDDLGQGGIHPTDKGYSKMAHIWYSGPPGVGGVGGIRAAAAMGWIKAPIGPDPHQGGV